jgi:hypothetical protein
MPTEYQTAPSENVERAKIPMISIGAVTGPAFSGGIDPGVVVPPVTANEALGDLLLKQLQQGGGSGNIGTEETPIKIPSTGHPFLVVGILAAAVVLFWMYKKEKI